MKKSEYYLNVVKGKVENHYPKVSGYIETVTDSRGIQSLIIGYDKRNEGCWMATELNTGFCVSQGTFTTKKKCVENVHSNIDIIVDVYNNKMTDEKYYENYIKPFKDYVSANGGFYYE